MKRTNTYGEILDLAVLAPSIQAYDLVQSSNVLVDFERGNGSKYIAVVSENPITLLPYDGHTYSLGHNFSDGSYVIARGTADSIDISDLGVGTWYLRIFEFNGFAGIEKYNRDEANDNPLTILISADEGIFDETFDETFE